ncbi:MAG: polyprenyl synthetase family protein, partial [Acidimicrobiales bacterium]
MNETTATAAPRVPEVLRKAKEVVAPAMAAALDRLDPDLRVQATYHLGWTDSEGNPTGPGEGKGIRPALALLSAEAAWADQSAGIPGAVAIELVHNFSLIHDDIIDGDEERHHRRALWTVYGLGPAIIAGDALATLANQVLLDVPPRAAENSHRPATWPGADASAALAEATQAMIAGQADDMAFERRTTVSVEECTAMCAAKTGALLGCASSIGAILAGALPATVAALRDYGQHLGLAFQAVDDLLGIWGDPDRTGKPAGSDLRQRKKTLPVVSALGAGGEEAEELRELLTPPPPGAAFEPLGPEEVKR